MTIDGETLVTFILKAPVDLIWNGGIGTYVKASSESHGDVNDGTNDRVRINAEELRARVVGEGGNLGFTQRARIEFASRGGRINTDAIDNSGGVDLSDHEVNLKLLLNPLVRSGLLRQEERNNLLKDIAADVVESVLQHNRSQALMLTIAQQRSVDNIEQYRAFIRDMNRLGYLDRTRDNLPDDEELDERISLKSGLTRSELAFCSAAVKMWMKEELCKSTLCLDPSLEDTLMNYFPAAVRERFPRAIQEHPLRREIVASELANEIISAVDIPFLHAATLTSGQPLSTIVSCLVAADRILSLPPLRAALRSLDTPERAATFLDLWNLCGETLRKAGGWLLSVHGGSNSLTDLIGLYQSEFEALTQGESRQSTTQVEGLVPLDSARLKIFPEIIATLEILWTTHEYKGSASEVARVFNSVVAATQMQMIFSTEHTLRPSNKWEQELIRGSYQEIRRALSAITGRLIGQGITAPTAIETTLLSISGFTTLRSTLNEIAQRLNNKLPVEIAALPVIARQLRMVAGQ